jgi:hypothetical protein
VPVPVVYGGIAAIVALLVAVGYFAGRASSTAGPMAASVAAPVAAPITAPAIAPAAPPMAVAEPAAQSPAAATFDAPQPPPSAAALHPAAGSAPSPAAAAGTPALRLEVAEYFRRMDATQSAAKTWSDPNALAQEILAGAMKGDSSGFDKLVASSAAARDGVRGIDPPPPCAEHHRLSLGLLDEAVTILTRLRDGIASGDPSAVASIASAGTSLENRAKAVDAMAASLRAQYGLPPAAP